MSFYQSMPLGQRSIELSHNIYSQFGKPLLSLPIVQNPYSYISPYAKKVDEMGDSTLSTIDEKFPVVKKTDFNTIKSNAHDAISFPFKVANDSKDYVFSTYSDEYKKAGGQGLVQVGAAVVRTELHIAQDVYQTIASYLGPKKDQAQTELSKAADTASDKAGEVQKTVSDKAGEAQKTASDKASEVQKTASDKAGDAQKVAKQKKNELKN